MRESDTLIMEFLSKSKNGKKKFVQLTREQLNIMYKCTCSDFSIYKSLSKKRK